MFIIAGVAMVKKKKKRERDRETERDLDSVFKKLKIH